MRVLVCIKMVPDTDMVLSSDWKADNFSNVDISYANKILNFYDEIGLELTLRFLDSIDDNKECKITALTIGGEKADFIIKKALSVKVDEGVRVDCDLDFKENVNAVPEIIRKAIEKLGAYDIIVLGQQSGVFDNGQTGYILAEKIKMPCISNVIKFEMEEDALKVTHLIDEGIEIISARLPLVLIIGNAEKAFLRMPTIREKIQANKKLIKTISLSDLEISLDMLSEDNRVKISEIYRYQKDINCEYIEDENSQKIASKLFNIIKK